MPDDMITLADLSFFDIYARCVYWIKVDWLQWFFGFGLLSQNRFGQFMTLSVGSDGFCWQSWFCCSSPFWTFVSCQFTILYPWSLFIVEFTYAMIVYRQMFSMAVNGSHLWDIYARCFWNVYGFYRVFFMYIPDLVFLSSGFGQNTTLQWFRWLYAVSILEEWYLCISLYFQKA